MMEEIVFESTHPIYVEVLSSRASRNITLRVQLRKKDTIRMRVPRNTTRDDILAIARTNESWIRDQLEKLPPLVVPTHGESIHYQGIRCRIVPGSVPGVRIDGKVLEVGCKAAEVPREIKQFLIGKAAGYMKPVVYGCARELGREVREVRFRDPVSIWGSCSRAGRVTLSWRLAMAPPYVQRAVAIHEACHLAEMNHGRRFYSLLRKFCPGYRAADRWDSDFGRTLQRYDFGDR
ncbi:MAG: SprT family zinc-dependent metalloprotease [Rhodobacteraceae bacterium]|nr:SprT family zinc-dependent metalloprotease [Paracoccaceae bacterium]